MEGNQTCLALVENSYMTWQKSRLLQEGPCNHKLVFWFPRPRTANVVCLRTGCCQGDSEIHPRPLKHEESKKRQRMLCRKTELELVDHLYPNSRVVDYLHGEPTLSDFCWC